MSVDTIALFAGPSLPGPCDVESRLPIQRLGPAAQGDILRSALLRPRAIVLIDGFFEAFPAVYHKEILWAISEGIPVYGAASTGALRASELHSYGMVGVGEIFKAFVDGRLVRDDEVALIHAPEEVGYTYLSEPLVNIRWTLNKALTEQILSPENVVSLLGAVEDTFYPDRNYERLLSECAKSEPEMAEKLGHWLSKGRIDQKNIDARACLERVALDFEAGNMAVEADFEFRHTDAFETLLEEVLSDSPAEDSEILERLRSASPNRFEMLRDKAEIAQLALALDRQSTFPISAEDLTREVSDFRLRFGLDDQTALKKWLNLNGLDIDTLSRELQERARISRARRSVEPLLDSQMCNPLTFAESGIVPLSKGD